MQILHNRYLFKTSWAVAIQMASVKYGNGGAVENVNGGISGQGHILFFKLLVFKVYHNTDLNICVVASKQTG